MATLIIIFMASAAGTAYSPHLYAKYGIKDGYKLKNTDELRTKTEEVWNKYARTKLKFHDYIKFSDIEFETAIQSLTGLHNEILISGIYSFTLDKLEQSILQENDEESKAYLEALLNVHLSALSHESAHMLQARVGLEKADETEFSHQEPILTPDIVKSRYPLYGWRHYVPYAISREYTGQAELSAVKFQLAKFRQEFAINPESLNKQELRALQPYLLYGIFSDELNTIFGNQTTNQIIDFSGKLGNELRNGNNSPEIKKYRNIPFIQALMIHYLWLAMQHSEQGKIIKTKLISGYFELGLSQEEIIVLEQIGESYFDIHNPTVKIQGVPLAHDLGQNQHDLMF